MAYAINIRSENESSEPIRSLWRECGLLEDHPSMEALNYPPHLTMAVYDDIDVAELFNALNVAFELMPKITIRFEELGYFETPQAIILWAAPILPSKVVAAHNRIHQLVDIDLCRPNYRIGNWVPHCSLATKIDKSRREAAIALSKMSIKPISVEFDVADCASFMPVEVLREIPLSVAA